MATTNKKPGLSLGKLSAVAQIAVKPADTEMGLERLYSVKQVRTSFVNLEELAESLKLNGVIEPLVVHQEADGRYRIIVGERRYRAAPLAGLASVPVIIKKGLTELQIRRIQVTENNDREDLTAYEEALGVIDDVEKYGTKEAMAIWNRGEAWLSKRVAVRRYADQVRQLLEEGLCGDFETLHCINQIYCLEDGPAEFDRIAQRLRDGVPVSRDDARNTLARLKAWSEDKKELEQRRLTLARAKPQEPQEVKPTQAEKPTKMSSSETPKKSKQLSQAEQAKQSAQQTLLSLRKGALHAGQANKNQFSSMKAEMEKLDYSMNETDWVLWQGFLAMTLPMLQDIGPDWAAACLKKLQTELKSKKLGELWALTQQNTEGDGKRESPAMPQGWRL